RRPRPGRPAYKTAPDARHRQVPPEAFSTTRPRDCTQDATTSGWGAVPASAAAFVFSPTNAAVETQRSRFPHGPETKALPADQVPRAAAFAPPSSRGSTPPSRPPPVARHPEERRKGKGRKRSREEGRSRACRQSVKVNEVSDRFQLKHHEQGAQTRRLQECLNASTRAEEAPATHPQSTMSCLPADDGAEACANCGKQGSDTVKLKSCTACRLVKYCGVDCQKAHRKQHKKACKQRAAELMDEQLYSQGHERPEGDFCPLCTLPIPLPMDRHTIFKACCMKRICDGCAIAAKKKGMKDCPFCRTPMPDNDADLLAMIRARVKKKDPEAMIHLGEKHWVGGQGLQKDRRRAVELFTEAAELGSIKALFNLGISYENGDGVEQDEAKAAQLYGKAAMQGSVHARHNLGCCEVRKRNNDRAVRHLLISAKMGGEDSVEMIKRAFMAGVATKEQYAEALKGYQDAVEEMKSHDRDEAKRLRYRQGVNKKAWGDICHLGEKYFQGDNGLQKDVQKAIRIDLYTEAEELGSKSSTLQPWNLVLHSTGREESCSVLVKGGNARACPTRHNLGLYDELNGNFDRAVRHYLISEIWRQGIS
ncbi:hypothetical protein THAOC_01177, partial [Thalassiosira oceanica]